MDNKKVGDGTVVAEPPPDHNVADEVSAAMATAKSIKAPAFQFYPKDFLSDANVMAMSLTELGAYWKLTCICWNEGSLPADTKSLARLLGVPQGHASKLWPAIAPCFKEKDNRLLHPRLEKERKKQSDYRKLQSERADQRWERERKKLATTELQAPHKPDDALHLQSAISNLQSATTSKKKNTDTAPAIDGFAQRLLSAYPPQGACSIHAATSALRDVLSDEERPLEAFDALLERLDGHKRSAKWAEQNGRFIPRLDRYLSKGTHLQVMASVEEVEQAKADAKLPAWARSSAS